MKIFFSSKTKLIKTADDGRKCRLCGTRLGGNSGSVAVIPYSLLGEHSTNKITTEEVKGCTDCNSTGKVKTAPPTYKECPTCKPGQITPVGVGQGPGVYRPNRCKDCKGLGSIVAPVHGGAKDETQNIECPTCHGNSNNIPLEECPSCKESDKPGFLQNGETQHNIVCPTCKGSKTHKVATPYTPILQVRCPHLDGADTFTRPNAEGATDELGPYDSNHFEGSRLLPLKLLWSIRGIGSKYHHATNGENDLRTFNGVTPQQVGRLYPPVPQIRSDKELTYLDFFSRTDLLDPDYTRTANNHFVHMKHFFNRRVAQPNTPENSSTSSNQSEINTPLDDFFGRSEDPSKTATDEEISLDDFFPPDAALPPLRKTLTPEQNKRLNGGPVTTRLIDESDMLRPYAKNPSKAMEMTKSVLKGQRLLSDKRKTMLKMFNDMKTLESKTTIKDTDSDAQKSRKGRRRSLGLRPTYRGWRDNLQTVSENLDLFDQLRGSLRKHLSGVLGKRMDPDISTAITSKFFREGKTAKMSPAGSGQEARSINLGDYQMGITEPMPYFKNDENWRESHPGFGCDHDPSGKHEPNVGCIIDYHNPTDNPREGVTTGINSRLVTGKYTTETGKTILQTVGARVKRAAESGLPKQELRGATPQWTPENFGRIVELPADRATCVANRIQREHYVVNHTIEPPSERTQYVSLPESETGIPGGLSPEPILNKEKIKFPEEIRRGGATESVYVGNPLYQLSNPFSSQEVERGMWANNPIVQHFANQIKDGKRPSQFKPYVPEPKFNSQKMKTRPGLLGPSSAPAGRVFDIDNLDDLSHLFNEPGGNGGEASPPKVSRKEEKSLDPVQENADDTYDTDKKLKVQKMQRTQVHMTEPGNPSAPDITPNVPEINYN